MYDNEDLNQMLSVLCFQLHSGGIGNSRGDLSFLGRDDDTDIGVLWLLDQLALTPGFTEQQLSEKLHQAHGQAVDHCKCVQLQNEIS